VFIILLSILQRAFLCLYCLSQSDRVGFGVNLRRECILLFKLCLRLLERGSVTRHASIEDEIAKVFSMGQQLSTCNGAADVGVVNLCEILVY